MLGKLIKHEFKATGRIIPFIYLSTLLMLLLSYVAKQTKINSLIFTSSMLTIVGIIACVIMTLVVIVTRFNSSMYKQEGYLTNTLPVSGNSLIFSKALVAFIWMLLAYALSIAMSFGLYFIHFEKKTYEQLANMFLGGTSIFWQYAGLMLVSILISSVLIVAMVYFSITLANVGSIQKYGGAMPFVVFIVVYLLNEAIGAVLTFLVPMSLKLTSAGLVYTNEAMINYMVDPLSKPPMFGFCAYIWYVILIVALFYATAKINEKKANVK